MKITLKISTSLIFFILLVSCSKDTTSSQTRNGIQQYLPVTQDTNILIISFDALRADAIGVYNRAQKTSPNIDKFAQDGLIFDNAHSTAQATPTSFAAAFTGKLPFRSFLGWKLAKTKTLAQTYKEAGYKTIFLTDNAQLVKERNFDQGFEDFKVVLSGKDEDLLPKALIKLEENRHKKFFAWFHFISPHAPYDYRKMSEAFYTPNYEGQFEKSVPTKYKLQNKDEINRVRELYNGEVFFADHIFGHILSTLSELELNQNTIIILTADHGEEFLEHGGTEHDSLFEEVIKIPLIIRLPDAKKRGRSNIAYANVDLFPTIAAISNLQSPSNLDGINLLNATKKNKTTIAIAMTKGKKIALSGKTGQNKLIQTCPPHTGKTFYNLQNDPKEQTDATEQYPQISQEISVTIQNIVGMSPCKTIKKSINGVSPKQGLSDQQINRLKSLGYMK